VPNPWCQNVLEGPFYSGTKQSNVTRGDILEEVMQTDNLLCTEKQNIQEKLNRFYRDPD